MGCSMVAVEPTAPPAQPLICELAVIAWYTFALVRDALTHLAIAFACRPTRIQGKTRCRLSDDR